MSQQGERAGGPDWWSRLYDGDTPDTGRAPAEDSVDERFDSATRTLGRAAAAGRTRPEAPEPEPAALEAEAPAREDRAQETPARDTPVREAPTPDAVPDAVPDTAGDVPSAHGAEPAALPAADPDGLPHLPSDTALDGARYGSFTLRAVSTRGDLARSRGEPRRDTLLTARFGSGEDALVLVAVAGAARGGAEAHRAAREVCHWIGASVGRSHARLSEDIRAARRAALKSGLHRLTGRGYGKLRARAAELGPDAAAYTADVRCLLLPADPRCRIRVFFGTGEGGLFRLRDGAWQDIEPAAEPEPAPEPASEPGPGAVPPEPPPFRFRASVARPGDTLLLCGAGLAGPMRNERAFADRLAERWAGTGPPGLARFLADARLESEGPAEDRTAAAVWEH